MSIDTNKIYSVYGINGPVVTIKGATEFGMNEMVLVGNKRLVGEVIRLDSQLTTIQVYEDTSGLKPGEPVYSTGDAMCVTLGPGILGNIYDGIQNPLSKIASISGSFIEKGIIVPAIDEEKAWDVEILVKKGDFLTAGAVYASCIETPLIKHSIMLSPSLSGEVSEVMPI